MSSDGLERMKTELREDVSGQSSGSDTESDSDAPTEVSMSRRRTGGRGGRAGPGPPLLTGLALAGQGLVFFL